VTRRLLSLLPVLLLLAGTGGAASLAIATTPSPAAAVATTAQSSPPPPPGRGPRSVTWVHPGAVPRSTPGMLSGTISAPGGPYLVDSSGRVVVLHGVNAVYKRAPYTLEVGSGRPWSFSAADAATIARLGFDVVRLGILWSGIEPGHGGINDAAVCRRGTPGNPHEMDVAVANRYLARVQQVVQLLGEYHIYTLLDMHQDLFSTAFGGEGAPAWAVCTDHLPIHLARGRWSRNYRDPALRAAVDNFWDNDVVGNLQGQYDQAWAVVAHHFRTDPWILGYDVYNEPFELELHLSDTVRFATELECFYTGRARPGHTTVNVGNCPATDPAHGVIDAIQSADPYHLVFVEPDIYTGRGRPDLLGPMFRPHLVFSFHAYCPFRNPVTGNPRNADACAAHVVATMVRRRAELPRMATPAQPGGPGLFMGEFGATSSVHLLTRVVAAAQHLELSWTEWAWRYYRDPTGSRDEGLVLTSGRLRRTAIALAVTYAQAIAGAPLSTGFDQATSAFHLRYLASARIHAPTVIFVPSFRYLRGYCTQVWGGVVTSRPGAAHLTVRSTTRGGPVQVTIAAGRCH